MSTKPLTQKSQRNQHDNAEFDRIYKGLNKAQKKAVDAIEGPVMVIAGPGTGKTTILTLRIANILRATDASPENILALTFTESGAYAMRKKLVSIIGPAGYKVSISTFHGFCNDIIGQYPEKFPRIIGSKAVSDIEQMNMMEDIFQKLPLDILKPYGDIFHHVKASLSQIKNLKKENISVADFVASIQKQKKDLAATPDLHHEKGAHKGKMKGEYIKLSEKIQKNEELATIYDAYEKALADKRYYDFEDMIVEVVKAMKADEDFLLMLQESYQYILADEHQDANNAQNTILEQLSSFHDNPNLFIVGDEKQAIFRFQGASLENFLYFKKIYPSAVLINLEENYRSNQTILDASHSLISNNAAPKDFERIKLLAKGPSAQAASSAKYAGEAKLPPIRVAGFVKPQSELVYVADQIKQLIESGVASDEIVVIYRNNAEAFPISYELRRLGVQYRIESDQNILADEEIRKLIYILTAIDNLTEEDALAKVLFVNFTGIKPLDAYKLLGHASKSRKNLSDIIHSEEDVKASGVSDASVIKKLSDNLLEWTACAKNKPFIECFETIVRESGFIDDALANEASLDRLATLEAFFGEVRRLAGTYKDFYLADFIKWLKLVEEHGLLVKGAGKILREGVRLMTAHRSKGLEFQHVFVIGLNDGKWGNKTRRETFHIPLLQSTSESSIEDERRLFYVALTRAKDSVSLSYSLQSAEGRELLSSQFIAELDPKLVKTVDVHTFEENLSKHPEKVFAAHAPMKASAVDRAYIHELFLERGLSATALNHYLECPWKYFFGNLLKLPQAKSKHQLYGTAIHEALNTFFIKYKNDEDMSADELIGLFEYNLGRLPISPSDYESTIEKGRKALKGWHAAYKGSWPRNLFTEYTVKGVHIEMGVIDGDTAGDGIAHNLLLRGQLDKVELISDTKVNVIDYKTKPPMSRGDIEGTIKTSNGDYKRQLVFYRLLLSLDEKNKFAMQSGEIDFTEPDDKGRYRKEKFEITDEEVEELKGTLRKVASEILSLEFWNKECDEKECEYCRLSKLLKRE